VAMKQVQPSTYNYVISVVGGRTFVDTLVICFSICLNAMQYDLFVAIFLVTCV